MELEPNESDPNLGLRVWRMFQILTLVEPPANRFLGASVAIGIFLMLPVAVFSRDVQGGWGWLFLYGMLLAGIGAYRSLVVRSPWFARSKALRIGLALVFFVCAVGYFFVCLPPFAEDGPFGVPKVMRSFEEGPTFK